MHRFPVLCALLAASALTQAQNLCFTPNIHGDEVVFTSEGDLWIGSVTTGEARRLTVASGFETEAFFSPDGSQIAFAAGYEDAWEAYVMPKAGGVPKRLSFDSRFVDVLGWTPDGSQIVYRGNGKLYASALESTNTYELFTVPPTGGMPMKVAVPRAFYASFHADGNRLAYVHTSSEWMNWFRYEAGEADSIWLADLKKHTFEKLTDSKGVDTQPLWIGDTIYFVSERSGVRNLFSLDPKTKKTKQLTFSTSTPVRRPTTDGKRIVYEFGTDIGLFDPATGEARVLKMKLGSDRIHARPYQLDISTGSPVAIGPTGKRVAAIAQGQLVTLPTGSGTTDHLETDSRARVYSAAWSSDGTTVAYLSDASGDEQVWTVDATGSGTPRQVTTALHGQHSRIFLSPDAKWLLIGDRESRIQLVNMTTGAVKTIAQDVNPGSYDSMARDFAFSPDSKWVTYSRRNERSNFNVFLYDIQADMSTPVTDSTLSSTSPRFSPDGQFLYCIQRRAISLTNDEIAGRSVLDSKRKLTAFTLAKSTMSPFAPTSDQESDPAKKPEAPSTNPIKVDLGGLSERIIDIPAPAGDYREILPTQSRILVISDKGLEGFDIAAKTMTVVAARATYAMLSHDGKKLLIWGANGPQVVDSSSPVVAPSQGLLSLAGRTVTVDPAAQWKQIFHEAWRVIRDLFYDPNMHGVDWNGVRKRYEEQLAQVGDRSDLNMVMQDMMAELNTGHFFLSFKGSYNYKPGKGGSLGIDVEYEKEKGAFRITKILRGDPWTPEDRSPLAHPGMNVSEGDYLLKIGTTVLSDKTNPDELLCGTAGQTIKVTVNSKPTVDGSRDIAVVPIESDGALRHKEWVKSRREYVRKASNGQIGYVYIPDMGDGGLISFGTQFDSVADYPAVIIDVRGNSGGWISGTILSDLASRITGYFSYRSGGYFRRESWAPTALLAAVTNEYAFSDGELFSEHFRTLKLGPLVGRRTGGGEVGSGLGYNLVDGQKIYVPNYGAWMGKEWIIEGRGVVPDYEVEQDQAAVMAGKDPQLDKAVQLLLEALKKNPKKEVKHPPYPVKTGGSRSGG